LPLRQPWRSGRGVFTHRAGWLVRLDTVGGLTGHGDCAPLPEAGTETAESALAALENGLPKLCGALPDEALLHLDEPHALPPAARCAMETALLDLLAQQAGVPLARWLNPAAPLVVAVNAAIGGLDEGVFGRAAKAAAEGFVVLKLKVGLVAPETELQLLRRLAEALPSGTVLRLDANGAWAEEEAERFVYELAGLPVESVEEPLARPEIACLRRLQSRAPFPLALDESLPKLADEILSVEPPVRRLVLKPMVLGGLRPAYALARDADRAGLECVVTTTVDSAVGVLAAAHLAAALGNNQANGLATSSWLLSNVGNTPQLSSAQLALDNGMNGLGFDVG
jgi:o-succinylbenzoate synthase